MANRRTVLQGRVAEVVFEPDTRTAVIGERCNALGYKAVREAVENDDLDVIVQRAIDQEAAGAHVINVNMVGTTVPEVDVLPEVVSLIANAVDAPVSIDFGDFDALEAALKVAPGRVLINSVNGEEQKLDPTLALAKQYDAALIAMTSDDEGIPMVSAGRLKVAGAIADRATALGVSVDDLVFDAICIGVATDASAGRETFATCQALRREFGANVVLGASNVSFGLPKRRTLDATYLAMAITAGVNVVLTDVTLPILKWSVLSADCCLGQDEHGIAYIQAFRAEKAEATA